MESLFFYKILKIIKKKKKKLLAYKDLLMIDIIKNLY